MQRNNSRASRPSKLCICRCATLSRAYIKALSYRQDTLRTFTMMYTDTALSVDVKPACYLSPQHLGTASSAETQIQTLSRRLATPEIGRPFSVERIATGGEITSIAHGLALIGEEPNVAAWAALFVNSLLRDDASEGPVGMFQPLLAPCDFDRCFDSVGDVSRPKLTLSGGALRPSGVE